MSPYLLPVEPALVCCPHPFSGHGPNGCLDGWGDPSRPEGGCGCLVRGPRAVLGVVEERLTTAVDAPTPAGRVFGVYDPDLVRKVRQAIEARWARGLPSAVNAALDALFTLDVLGRLGNASPVFHDDGTTVTVEWPGGPGPSVISPTMVEEWVAVQNEIRRLRAEVNRQKRIRGSLAAEIKRVRDGERVTVLDPDEGFIQTTRGELASMPGWERLTCHCGVSFNAGSTTALGQPLTLRPVHYPDGSHGFEALLTSGSAMVVPPPSGAPIPLTVVEP